MLVGDAGAGPCPTHDEEFVPYAGADGLDDSPARDFVRYVQGAAYWRIPPVVLCDLPRSFKWVHVVT